jgi:flagellar hook-associated protein 3 FlgL
MRVTQEGMVNNALARLQERLSSVDRAGRRLSSGKAVQVASDDVSGMNRVLGLRSQIRAREQESRNGADALSWLNIADSKLQTANNRLGRGRELMVRAGSSQDATARNAMADEVLAIREELLGVANTSIGDRALFGGTASTTTPYDNSGVYSGDDGVVTRRVGEGDSVQVNVTGPDVFGEGTGADENVFEFLERAATEIRAGGPGVTNLLGEIDTYMERLTGTLATVGAATNRIDAAMLRNADEQLVLKGELAKVQDIDLAAAVMDLQTQEVAYQATLAALSRVLQPSLVDFLR